jgi:hypothetical protein
MPEHLRALIVLLGIGLIFFWQSSSVTSRILSHAQHRRWRYAWLGVTLAAFLAHNFWIFCLLYVGFVLHCKKRDGDPFALYVFLLLALPAFSLAVPGFGMVNYFIDLSPPRLLILALLLPTALIISSQSSPRFGKLTSDKLLLAYVLLEFVLTTRGTTVTDAMRGLVYSLIDAVLPYYVGSRVLKQPAHFTKVTYAYVLAAGLISAIGLFEFLRHWLLYASLPGALGADAAIGGYLAREGMIRASATTGQAIALGYAVLVALGLFLYLQNRVAPGWNRNKVWLLLCGGLAASLSRGPWVGAVITLAGFILTGPRAVTNTMRLAAAGMFALVLAAVLPGGEKVLNLIPFLGNTEVANIDYRKRLIDNAMVVIHQNVWFGSVDYLKTPEMQSMMQGQGIIDIVNSYIGVTLNYGVVGLALFVLFFLVILFSLYRIVRAAPDKTRDDIRLGRALLATWVGIMVTIFTVSSISFIPYIYWTVGGIAVAYIQMMKNPQGRDSHA